MSARLVLAVLVPIVALGMVGARVIADRHSDLRKAEAVSEQVHVLDELQRRHAGGL